jgi:1-deoxy-D-xylulose-5-phosphate reductoisomerase
MTMDRSHVCRVGIAVIGSTGSIGINALSVIERHPDLFQVLVLAANRSAETLESQARRHPAAQVILCDEAAYRDHRGAKNDWVIGRARLIESVARPDVDVVVNGLVGFAGLEPSLRALEAGKRLALANKESLVAGGELMIRALRDGGGQLVPIDSEHSAVMQCLGDRPTGEVARVILTASGGPFRGWSLERLAGVRPSDALQHPTWDMGAKITVDSATLGNKALEIIEAHFLYGIPYDHIEAVVHPQSIIHSLVEFVDGSVIAQLGFPNMELPILQALTYPERVPDPVLRTFDPMKSPSLTFEPIEPDAFPLFGIGTEAGRRGGMAPTVFNAANEVAVAAFLAAEVSFPMIADIVGATLARADVGPAAELEDVLAADLRARMLAREHIDRGQTAVGGYVS